MRYVFIVLLALVAGGLIGSVVWRNEPQPVDPLQVIVNQLKTHAIVEHERQIAVWYRVCPEVVGIDPQIFVAWPAKLSYELELSDVTIERSADVITVRTGQIRADEPSVPTDFSDYLATDSLLNFSNEQQIVNAEIGKSSPIARYLSTYFLARDPSLREDFAFELRTLVERMAAALGVQAARVEIDIPEPKVSWPKLPHLELCAGSAASVNGMPFARMEGQYTVPIGFKPASPGRSSDRAAHGTAPTGIVSVYAWPAMGSWRGATAVTR